MVYGSCLRQLAKCRQQQAELGVTIHAWNTVPIGEQRRGLFLFIDFNCLRPSWCLALRIILLRDGQEELEFRRKLLFGVQTIREVDAADATICMNLNAQSLDVVGTIRSSGEIG